MLSVLGDPEATVAGPNRDGCASYVRAAWALCIDPHAVQRKADV